jgi:tetratricopeptide (TPR) repeat protein
MDAFIEESQPDYKIMIEAGLVAIKKGKMAEAMALFDGAKCLRPDTVEADMGIGYLFFNQLDSKRALEAFERVLAVKPDYLLAKVFIAMVGLLNVKSRFESIEKLETILKNQDDPEVITMCQEGIAWGKELGRKPVQEMQLEF